MSFNLDEYRRVRRELTSDEWLDFIVRRCSFEYYQTLFSYTVNDTP